MKENHQDQNMAEKQKNKLFSDYLILHLMRSGKKSWAYKTVFDAANKISLQLNRSILEVYSLIFNRLRPYIEIRKVRVRRSSYLVPFPTNLKRQKHLSAFWLLETVRQDKRNISFEKKLEEELIKILLNRGATLEKKKEMYKKAEKSRSFLHYRWY